MQHDRPTETHAKRSYLLILRQS